MPVRTSERPAVRRAAFSRRAAPAALRAGALLLGVLGARAPLLGGQRPLGICFTVSVPGPYALFTAAGAVLGYGLPPGGHAAPCIAAIAAAALLRGLARLGRAPEAPMAPAGASCLIYCLVRCGLAAGTGGGLAEICAAVAASMLALGLSYLLAGFFALPRPLHVQGGEECASLCFAYMALLACLAPFAPLGFSAAHLLAAGAVLAGAMRGRAGAAAVLGVASMLALCAVQPGDAFAGLGIAAGGLAAVLFAGRSRAAASLAFCCAGLAGVVCAPDAMASLRLAAELCCAAAVCCLLPAHLLRAIPDSLSGAAPGGISGAGERLAGVADALGTVGDTMRAVCRSMPPRFESVAELGDDIAARCCGGCEKRLSCWVDGLGAMYDALNALAPRLKEGSALTPEELPAPLAQRCCAPLRLACTINTAAAAQGERRAARARMDAARAALCEQYTALAAALAGLAAQTDSRVHTDPHRTRRFVRLLRTAGLEPLEAGVTLDAAGRVTACASVARAALTDAEKDALRDGAAAALGRALAPGEWRDRGAATHLSFREAPRWRVESAATSLPARDGISADAVRTFTDADGRFLAVLCDGMGTGRRAAVGGVLSAALARELLRAGVTGESAARLVNIALSVKGDEENAVTLDVFTLDPYTGSATLYKAGAAATFVLHEGSCAVYSSDTLPIGILDRVCGRQEDVCVSPGDTVVLVSDGALAPGGAWLRRELLRHENDAPPVLSSTVARAALERQKDAPDDITVLAVRIL